LPVSDNSVFFDGKLSAVPGQPVLFVAGGSKNAFNVLASKDTQSITWSLGGWEVTAFVAESQYACLPKASMEFTVQLIHGTSWTDIGHAITEISAQFIDITHVDDDMVSVNIWPGTSPREYVVQITMLEKDLFYPPPQLFIEDWKVRYMTNPASIEMLLSSLNVTVKPSSFNVIADLPVKHAEATGASTLVTLIGVALLEGSCGFEVIAIRTRSIFL